MGPDELDEPIAAKDANFARTREDMPRAPTDQGSKTIPQRDCTRRSRSHRTRELCRWRSTWIFKQLVYIQSR